MTKLKKRVEKLEQEVKQLNRGILNFWDQYQKTVDLIYQRINESEQTPRCKEGIPMTILIGHKGHDDCGFKEYLNKLPIHEKND